MSLSHLAFCLPAPILNLAAFTHSRPVSSFCLEPQPRNFRGKFWSLSAQVTAADEPLSTAMTNTLPVKYCIKKIKNQKHVFITNHLKMRVTHVSQPLKVRLHAWRGRVSRDIQLVAVCNLTTRCHHTLHTGSICYFKVCSDGTRSLYLHEFDSWSLCSQVL